MFERLAAEVQHLPHAADGASLEELGAIRDRLEARYVAMVADFDQAGLWDLDGSASCTAWLRTHLGISGRDAGRLANLAKKLRQLPVTSGAWAEGRLTRGQVDAVIANVGRHLNLFAEHEGSVVPSLEGLSVSDTVVAMQHWRRLADDRDEPDPGDSGEPERSLHLSASFEGRGLIDGDLDPDTHAIVAAALRVAATSDCAGEPARTPATRRADALADVCRFFLDNQTARPGGRHRPHLNVVVDLETLTGDGHGTARTVTGIPLTRTFTEQLCCDAAIHRLLTKGRSAILDYGTTTRTIAAPLWAALVARDHGCRFPGCDRPATWCDAHHVRWVTHGGATNPQNLVVLCRRHHRRLHTPGWTAHLGPDATLEVTDPTGTTRTTRPPGADPPLFRAVA